MLALGALALLVVFVHPYTTRGRPCGEVRCKYSAKSCVAEQLHDLVAGNVDGPSGALSLSLSLFLLVSFSFFLCAFFVFVIIIIFVIFVFIVSGLED